MLVRAIESGEELLTTGLVLQELLQDLTGPRILIRSMDCRVKPGNDAQRGFGFLRRFAGKRRAKAPASTET